MDTFDFARECACRLANQGMIPANRPVWLLKRIIAGEVWTFRERRQPPRVGQLDCREATVLLRPIPGSCEIWPTGISLSGPD